jgi:hypothetical protein
MAGFSKGIARWMVLSGALAIFVLVPPEILARGPDICLWKRLFHIAACPAWVARGLWLRSIMDTLRRDLLITAK